MLSDVMKSRSDLTKSQLSDIIGLRCAAAATLLLSSCLLALLPDAWALSACPNQHCECKNPQFIDCSENTVREQFTAVPYFEVASVKSYTNLSITGHNIRDIPDDVFINVNSVINLDLSRNPIATFGAGAFTGITNLTQLKFTLDSGAAFPVEALAPLKLLRDLTVTRLSGSHQEPPDMPTATLRALPSLRTLSLSISGIQRLTRESFDGLVLESLQMSQYTKLVIDSHAFETLQGNLTTLHMDSCQIGDGCVAAFSSLVNLVELDLSFNDIVTLGAMFSRLGSVRKVNLANNKINALTRSTFTGARSLRVLYLNDNPLDQLQPDAFQSLVSLHELSLAAVPGAVYLNNQSFITQRSTLYTLTIGGTAPKQIQWGMFSGLSVLETLIVTGCNAVDIPDFTFRYSTRLKILRLTNNSISEVTSRSLAGTEDSLERLDLITNNIVVLDPCTFNHSAPTTLQLYLQNNPLSCNCSLAWLHNWLVVRSGQNVPWTCDGGKKVSELPASQFADCAQEKPVCEDWRTLFTTLAPPSLVLRVESAAHSSLSLAWDVVGISEDAFDGFQLTWRASSDHVTVLLNGSALRRHELGNLQPNTAYHVCLSMRNTDPRSSGLQSCLDNETAGMPDSSSNLVLWSCLGGASAAAVIMVIIVFCCCAERRMRHQHYMSPHALHTPQTLRAPALCADTPTLCDNTKRFMKPKTSDATDHAFAAPVRAKSIADQLNELTEDERYKLVNLLTHSGGSMASLDYSTSRSRTLPLHMGAAGNEGYHYSLERRRLESRHVYDEIADADDEFYAEISTDEIV